MRYCVSFFDHEFRFAFVMASEIRNLMALRVGAGAKKLALSSSVVPLFHLIRHQPATNLWRSVVPVVCVNPPCLDHLVGTTLTNWDTTIHLHLVASRGIQLALPIVLP